MLLPALRRTAPFLLFLCPAAAQTPGHYLVRHGGQQRSFAAAAEAGTVVLYETGRARGISSRRRITGEIVAHLTHPEEIPVIAALTGANAWRRAPVLEDAFIFIYSRPPLEVLAAADRLRLLPGVHGVEPVLARAPALRWTPNDPFFANNPANAGYQWHLKNTGARGGIAGVDINISAAWVSWRGAGLRIGIIDNGLQTNHPDLAANVDTANDFDWNGNDDDPSPGAFDHHGTCCAGAAAGRGNNGIGICGAAPEATLVGMRLISPDSNDTTEAAAFLHLRDLIQIKNNSWGPSDDGSTIEGPGTLAAAALAEAAATGRGGLGTLVTWAAGNGLAFGDDSNYDGYANSIYTMAVTAIGDNGVQTNSAEPGANILISAPSAGGAQEISTTDRTGSSGYNTSGGGNYASVDYHNGFDGTSAATAITAGGLAVLLQSRPMLGWRDVKEILIRSAVQNHASDPGWFTNAAGFHFNDKYGAGLLNVSAAVTLAAAWTNLGPLTAHSAAAPGALAIPDNSPAGVTCTFTFSAAQSLRVEQIALAVNVTHPRRGQLEYTLTSPSGTVSRLARPRPDYIANLAWTFTTPQFWGESATGTWTLRVRDTVASRAGTLNTATLTLHGTVPDADGDGFDAAAEAWFGTSDSNPSSAPIPEITLPGGTGTITFPSVPGNAYTIESSPNLGNWTPHSVTATGASTTWTDPAGPSPPPRYYRVRRP